MKPFLKWLGNKNRIKDRIIQALPAGKRLIEPFTGSGAIFLNTDYNNYLLAERNQDLINLYQVLQDEGEKFIKYSQKYFTPENNCPEVYYQLRDKFNNSKSKRVRSALFIYLNKHCYNGLCRYNSSGEFNVPFGSYSKPYFPAQEMLYFYQKSQQVKFIHSDFSDTFSLAKSGDIIYCDPPYIAISDTANFTSYTADKFNQDQQIKLAQLATQAAERGIPVVISNHDTPFTREHYKTARIESFLVQRNISCNHEERNKVAELLAIFD